MSGRVLIIILYGVMMNIFNIGCKAKDIDSDEFAKLRENMVKTQIERRGVKDEKVLNAIMQKAKE